MNADKLGNVDEPLKSVPLHNAKKFKSSSSSSCSSSSSSNSKTQLQQQQQKHGQPRSRTPPGLENLPIPPPVLLNSINSTNTSSCNNSSTPNPASLDSWLSLFNPATAAAMMAFNPFLTTTSSNIQPSSQITNFMATLNNSGRYQPYMSQLAMVANMSNLNQSTANVNSNSAIGSSSSSSHTKYFNKA